jgi:acetyl-CoA carboxylase carboxyltransferase component
MTLAAVPRPEERFTPLEALEVLCDRGSLELVRSEAVSRHADVRAEPGDGVIGGAGHIGGRPVFCYAQDQRFAGGSLGETHADTIVRLHDLAGRARTPVVGVVSSAGARLQEGLGGLGGYGRIFRAQVALSGRVPQIAVISGVSAGGGVYSPALCDFVVMSQRSTMFLTGPAVVREVLGEDLTMEQLGGPKVHGSNGVCHMVAPTDADALHAARDLLSYLPQHAGAATPHVHSADTDDRDPSDPVPRAPRAVYDVKQVIARLVDRGALLEVAPRWARNIVCGFARLDGRPVGVVANQPKMLGGVIDTDASQKGARFVRTCHLFGLPLIVLVDTPGFMPGLKQETAGVIRHGAKLLHAFAEARVPKVTVVVRKAFGGAFITMNSKDLGADFVFAWPQAQIGVMGAQPAVGITHRRELAAAADPDRLRRRLAAEYAETHLGAATAARQGYADEVISPRDTRRRLTWALSVLNDKGSGDRHATNIPL